MQPHLSARGSRVLQYPILIEGETLCEGIWEALDVVGLHQLVQLGTCDGGVLGQDPNQRFKRLEVDGKAIVCLGFRSLQQLQARRPCSEVCYKQSESQSRQRSALACLSSSHKHVIACQFSNASMGRACAYDC